MQHTLTFPKEVLSSIAGMGDGVVIYSEEVLCPSLPGGDTTGNLKMHLKGLDQDLESLRLNPLSIVVDGAVQQVQIDTVLTSDRAFNQSVGRRGSGGGDEFCPRCPATACMKDKLFEVVLIPEGYSLR